MTSIHYTLLSTNVSLLRKHLLPARFDPIGAYKPAVFTKAIAFRLLCHAAVEQYFEDRAAELAQASLEALEKRGKTTRIAICVASFSGRDAEKPPTTLVAPQPSQAAGWPKKIDILERVRVCVTDFVNFARTKNHGIREKDVLRLLLPVGLDPGLLNATLVAELDSYGVKRGAFAHTGVSAHVSSMPNPMDELLTIQRIMSGLKALDTQMETLLASTV